MLTFFAFFASSRCKGFAFDFNQSHCSFPAIVQACTELRRSDAKGAKKSVGSVASYLSVENMEYFKLASFARGRDLIILVMSVMRECDDIPVVWRIVPTRTEGAGFVLPVKGILALAVHKQVVLDKESRAINEIYPGRKRHGRTVASVFGDGIACDDIRKLLDDVIEHRSVLSIDSASRLFLPGQIAMP